jgi:membrane protease YdiL (CAAX protease family)
MVNYFMEAFVNGKKIFAILSPIVVISLCGIFVIIFSKFILEWVFIPTAIIYWLLSFTISLKIIGKETIKNYFNKPIGNIGWLILAIIIGFIPFSILLQNTNLLNDPIVILLWLLFSLINPFFEEIFWRGLLLENIFKSKAVSTIYSTVLFVISHLCIWGIFSYGNRNIFTIISLIIMGIVWCIIRYKTKSLWWSIISHIMVDGFNLCVFVFLNLYIPEQGLLY